MIELEKVYVFGHKKPDTDSVCGAISFAYLKRQIGVNAEARVLGEINRETQFALKKFKQKVARDGVPSECKKREGYDKPGVKRREEKKKNIQNCHKNNKRKYN